MGVSSVLLVGKQYEERRAYATARKLWPEVHVVSASTSMTLNEYVEAIGDAHLVIDMFVGAHQRLLVHPDQGFTIRQEVPVAVTAAYERLCSAGFTSRLVGDRSATRAVLGGWLWRKRRGGDGGRLAQHPPPSGQ